MTPAEIDRILSGMDGPARAEFLELLELKERADAEKPQDNTPQVHDLLTGAVRRASNATDDPDGFMAGYEAHREAAARHLKRLRRGRPSPMGLHDLLRQALETDDDHVEAAQLATADGFADPFVRPVGPVANPMGSSVPLGILQR